VTKLIVAFRNFANVPKKQLETAFKEGVVRWIKLLLKRLNSALLSSYTFNWKIISVEETFIATK